MPDPHPTPTALGTPVAGVQADPEPDRAAREHEVEVAIEAATGFPVPAEWTDPLARARRRGILQDAARQAARAQVELLIQAGVCADRGATLQPSDPVVGVMFDALTALHRVLWAYRHDARLCDGSEIVTNAMEDEAGAGVAAIVDGLLTRLRYSPSRSSTGSYSRGS